MESLYVNFDFDEAQAKLKECKTVIENDFFIVGCLDEFTENARLIISEIFCRIHQVGLELTILHCLNILEFGCKNLLESILEYVKLTSHYMLFAGWCNIDLSILIIM